MDTSPPHPHVGAATQGAAFDRQLAERLAEQLRPPWIRSRCPDSVSPLPADASAQGSPVVHSSETGSMVPLGWVSIEEWTSDDVKASGSPPRAPGGPPDVGQPVHPGQELGVAESFALPLRNTRRSLSRALVALAAAGTLYTAWEWRGVLVPWLDSVAAQLGERLAAHFTPGPAGTPPSPEDHREDRTPLDPDPSELDRGAPEDPSLGDDSLGARAPSNGPSLGHDDAEGATEAPSTPAPSTPAPRPPPAPARVGPTAPLRAPSTSSTTPRPTRSAPEGQRRTESTKRPSEPRPERPTAPPSAPAPSPARSAPPAASPATPPRPSPAPRPSTPPRPAPTSDIVREAPF